MKIFKSGRPTSSPTSKRLASPTRGATQQYYRTEANAMSPSAMTQWLSMTYYLKNPTVYKRKIMGDIKFSPGKA